MPHPNISSKSQIGPISKAFVTARLNATSLPEFPGVLPATLDEAYDIQDDSIACWPDEVAGWKVGGIPPALQKELGAERVTGPIFEKSVRFDNSSTNTMPVVENGFAAIEAEFVIKVGQDVEPGSVDRDSDAVLDLIEGFHIGVEIASSPLLTINDIGPLCVVSDFGNNAGLIVGPSIDNWRSIALEDLKARVDINGQTIGEASAADNPGGPFEAFRFLISHFSRRGMTMRKGSFISTGAVTGVHQAHIGDTSVCDFGKHGCLNLELVKADPFTKA